MFYGIRTQKVDGKRLKFGDEEMDDSAAKIKQPGGRPLSYWEGAVKRARFSDVVSTSSLVLFLSFLSPSKYSFQNC